MSYDVIVLGGGPAGMSAALNVLSRGRSALVVSNPLQENPLWQAEKVDNHLGMPAQSGAEMLTNLRRHAEEAGVVFREGRVVSAMALEDTWYVSIGAEMETASALVLASGVLRGRKFPGEAEFLGRGVSYCATCDGMLYRGKNVVVLDYEEIINEWANDTDVHVHLTIDREQEGWDGHVGFVPNYVKELGFDTNKTAVLCGPPIMIKFTLEGLCALGFDKTQIYTTLELRMKCGVGKCGRCNVGSKYVCKDGPVFRCDELEELPSEY